MKHTTPSWRERYHNLELSESECYYVPEDVMIEFIETEMRLLLDKVEGWANPKLKNLPDPWEADYHLVIRENLLLRDLLTYLKKLKENI
jgi:hypothetical protein